MNAMNDTDVVKEGARFGDLGRVCKAFLLLAAIGVVAIALFSIAVGQHWYDSLNIIGGAMLLAGALTLGGSLVGFIFAIPRSRQDQAAVPVQAARGGEAEKPPQRLSDYAANTNLEQISDWLTKILVGIGLVQFKNIVHGVVRMAEIAAPLLGAGSTSKPAALMLMGYFASWGFFFAYLFTRLWLPKALSRAEREEQVQKRAVEKEAELQELERQVYDYLYQSPPGGYTRAIEAIERYQQRPGSRMSAWLWVYLASAYGQKHKDQTGSHETDFNKLSTRNKVVEAVARAIELDAGTVPILSRLYLADDPNEDDLNTLKGDKELDRMLKRPKGADELHES